MYALNVNEDGRILSTCIVLPNGKYDGMPLVETLPDGDITDYLYVDGEYIYDPLPEPEQPEPTPTPEERITALEERNAQLEEALALLLSGETEGTDTTDTTESEVTTNA